MVTGSILNEFQEWISCIIVGYFWLECGWETYLCCRQLKVYNKQHVTLSPELDDIAINDTFQKARAHGRDKLMFRTIKGIFSQLLNTIMVLLFAHSKPWNGAKVINQKILQGLKTCLWTLHNLVLPSCWIQQFEHENEKFRDFLISSRQ